jgi:hypothetical protein
VVNVRVPRNLTPEQRDLVERLGDSLTEENLTDPEPESLFQRVRRALR